jgi:hypothetical protein
VGVKRMLDFNAGVKAMFRRSPIAQSSSDDQREADQLHGRSSGVSAQPLHDAVEKLPLEDHLVDGQKADGEDHACQDQQNNIHSALSILGALPICIEPSLSTGTVTNS